MSHDQGGHERRDHGHGSHDHDRGHGGHDHDHGHGGHDHGHGGHDRGHDGAHQKAGDRFGADGKDGTLTRFRVPAMDCATEKEVIAARLRRVTEVRGADFDLLDRIVSVRHEPGAEARVQAALQDIGMAPERLTTDLHALAIPGGASKERPSLAGAAGWTRGGWLLWVGGAGALAAEIASWSGVSEQTWWVIALSVATLLSCGPTTFRKGFVAARNFTLNINLLMTIAVVGAIAIGEWPEAAMVTFLFAVAELVESKSVERARDAIRSLMALTPDTARVRRGDKWMEIAATDVVIGDVVQVLPGERIPVEGKVKAGTTAIDQAPITGESIPVDKSPGDQVFAGTINQAGAIEIDVTVAQGDTTLDRIARTIRDAQSQKAPTERFVDQFARWYTPIVVLLAFGIAVIPPLVTSQAFVPWLYKALVMLVIACPCALVISTPVTIVSGLAAAARRGILVKGGVYLEQVRHLRIVALDKTGTLTRGRPDLVDAIPLGAATRDELLRYAASLEATSTHPIAQAVVRGATMALAPVTDAKNIVGRGIEGTVEGTRVTVGNHRLAEERQVCNADIERELARLEDAGHTVMVVWTGHAPSHRVLGVIGVADVIRETTVEAIKTLHRQGLRVAMLTGDNPTTARTIGKQAGIDDVEADLLPEDKLAAIDRLREKHGNVGMVGDGVNDTPALARADIGFAMGAAGTDTALETADVALMKDDLRGLAEFVELGKRCARTLRTNIGLSIAIKVVFFALALAGIATLWMAVFADMGASLLVAANGLRLLRFEPTS